MYLIAPFSFTIVWMAWSPESLGLPQQGSGSRLSTQLIMILQPNDEWSTLIGWHCENTGTHFRGHKTDVTRVGWSINKIDTLDNNNNGIDAS